MLRKKFKKVFIRMGKPGEEREEEFIIMRPTRKDRKALRKIRKALGK